MFKLLIEQITISSKPILEQDATAANQGYRVLSLFKAAYIGNMYMEATEITLENAGNKKMWIFSHSLAYSF